MTRYVAASERIAGEAGDCPLRYWPGCWDIRSGNRVRVPARHAKCAEVRGTWSACDNCKRRDD